jgi:general secretion pathway protein E
MLPLETIRIERFAVSGVLWLLVAVAWVALAIWVERDARSVLGRSLPLRTVFAALGVSLVLGTFLLGAAALPVLSGLVALATTAYVIFRESVVVPDRRLVPIDAWHDLLRSINRATGLERWQQRVGAGLPSTVSLSGSPAVLLKNDGTMHGSLTGSTAATEASPAITAAQGILGDAVAKRATEVWLEPDANRDIQLRYRIDGMMQPMHVLPAELGRAVITVLKTLSDASSAEHARPLDTTFAVLADGHRFDVHAVFRPAHAGGKITLRLRDADGSIIKDGLAGLGMRSTMVQSLRGILQQSRGMLIVCGPNGSGRTTTAYAALREIDVLVRSIVTIDDPIEYRLENVSQTAVDKAGSLSFAKILRSSLRHDPDVILVGEIRDKETAEMALQAANTGHFVVTTIRASDTAATVAGLLDSGIDAPLVTSTVTAVLAQRLVRRLCPQCKVAYQPPPELLRRLGLPPDKVTVLYKEVGCATCLNTGFRGRSSVHELLILDNVMRELIASRPSVEAIRAAARKTGMRTLLQSALLLACEGVTSISEAERVTR